MSRTYTGEYVVITNHDKDMLARLLEYTQGTKRLADWLCTSEPTLLNWINKPGARFRTGARERIELLQNEIQVMPKAIHTEPTPLRGIYDRLNHVQKNMLSTEYAIELRNIVGDFAIILIDRGEA